MILACSTRNATNFGTLSSSFVKKKKGFFLAGRILWLKIGVWPALFKNLNV